jgi:membrane fusion protein (multidrug efflux system)
VKPAATRWVWIALTAIVVGGVAAPKVLPLLHGSAGARRGTVHGSAAVTGGHGRGARVSGPLPVSTVVVKAEPYSETVTAAGSLLADEGVDLQAETSGKVVAINFTEGAQVRRGDLLVKLNDADLLATLRRARHNLELAQLREHRVDLLLKDGAVTQSDYDTAHNDVIVQNDEITLIESQIAKTEIRAPFDGVVGLRYVSVGALVSAATRVATLQRLDKLKLDFSVPERYAPAVRVGNPVSFSVAGRSEKFAGTIYAFDPRIDTTTRTVTLRAICPNPGGRLLPGAFVNVEMSLARVDDAIFVPSIAVVPGLSEKNVFVIDDGKAVRRNVTTGTRTETAVQILSGLQPGDVVITSGLQEMHAGEMVVARGDESRPPPSPAPATAADAAPRPPHAADAVNLPYNTTPADAKSHHRTRS